MNESYLRFFQPFCDGSEDIIIRPFTIVKARGINKDNVASTTIRVRTADSANILCARVQVVTDLSEWLSCCYINELHWWSESVSFCGPYRTHRAFTRPGWAHYTRKLWRQKDGNKLSYMPAYAMTMSSLIIERIPSLCSDVRDLSVPEKDHSRSAKPESEGDFLFV